MDRQLSVGIREAIAAGYESVKPGWTRLGFAYFITQVRGPSGDFRDSLQILEGKTAFDALIDW